MIPETLAQAREYALWFTAVVGGVSALWLVLRWIRGGVRWVDVVAGLPARLDTQDRVLDEIRHEVTYNNGTSVKDAVDRIEKALTEHVGKANADDADQWAALDKLADLIDNRPDDT